MSTNTYRLAVTLQAKAIDSIDLHTRGAYTVAHTVGDYITVIARYRTGAGQRILQMWAHDADAHLLGSAEANRPVGGGLIASHVTAFRCQHLRWERRVIPTATQYRNPAELAVGAHPSQAQIGFHACGRADYYLTHDWAPGPFAPRPHLVTARRNRPQRSGPGPHQGRRRHRHQLHGRPGDPPPGRHLT